MDTEGVISTIRKSRLFLILRHISPARVAELSALFREAGIEVVEVALNSDGAVDSIARLRKIGFTVGAGTAVEPGRAEEALKAGAQFLVSPTLEPFLPGLCGRYGAVCMPGAFTPTEILAAHRAGAHFVKVFPASVLGPAFIKAVLAPLPELRLVPVGGVSSRNIAEYLNAGAVAVGVGSALLSSHSTPDSDSQSLLRDLSGLVEIASTGG